MDNVTHNVQFLAVIVLAYLIGSIPFGILVTRLMGGGDVRSVGSGNIGATNVLRAAGKKAAFVTLIADGAKGFLPVFAVSALFDAPLLAAGCGIAAVLGHNFPAFLKFKGGKGVAASLGVALAMTPWLGIACLLIWFAAAVIGKYSSLSALITFAAYPLMVFSINVQGGPAQFLSLFLFGMIYYRHRDNIKRLVSGEEPKIGQKR